MNEHSNYAFELGAIHGKLETLGAGQDEICRRLDVDVKSRLDKVNGSIATLYQRTDDNKAALLSHVIDCPQKERIERLASRLDEKDLHIAEKLSALERRMGDLDRKISERIAADNNSSKWRDKLLYPLVRIAATGLVLILLYHAQEILKRWP